MTVSRRLVSKIILNDIYDDDSSYLDVADSVAEEVVKHIRNLGRQCRLRAGTDGHVGRVGVVCNVFQSGSLQVFFDQLNILVVRVEDVEWIDEVPDRPVGGPGEKENAQPSGAGPTPDAPDQLC